MRTAPTLAQLLPIILDQLNNLFHANGSLISIYDPYTDEMVVELGTGMWDWFTGHRIPPGSSKSHQVMNTREVYHTEDARNEPTFFWADILKDPTAVVISPLIVQKEAIGTIWVSREENFNDEEIRLIGLIRDIAASAIHRASLHEQTERRLSYLMGLRMIDSAIVGSFNLDATLDLLVHQAISQLGIDAAAILLFNQKMQTLEFAAGDGFRGEEIQQARVTLGQTYAGKAAAERKMVRFSSNNMTNHSPQFESMIRNEGFIEYYGLPLISKGNLKGVLEIFHRAPLKSDPEWLDFMEMLSQQAAIAIDNSELFESLQQSNRELALAYDSTLEGWSHALDMRDKETEGHTQRVVELTLQLAIGMGVCEEESPHIRRGALLHDIGKMAIPDAILHKAGRLDKDEMEIMRKHPVFAYELISPISYLNRALDIPYYHHEKWDGSGYPHGLKGEEIPLAARIFAIVDVWDALRSDRPYRPAWSDEEALEYIRSQSGHHFDPGIVDIFLDTINTSN
jgi:HD-GYP domain-containing protein (c-di-GMP phosphodiesterase class II)